MKVPHVGPMPAKPARPDDGHARLRAMSSELEAVFLQQLFKAMRDSVPRDGILTPSPGEDVFTSMLDERLANLMASRSTRGLGQALYEQLSRALPPENTESPVNDGSPGKGNP